MKIESSAISTSGMLSALIYNSASDNTENTVAQETNPGHGLTGAHKCHTCANRKYQDGSEDSGVSFQTPTKVNPEAAAAKVRTHEQEHVGRNQAKAEREGSEVVAQSVVLHTAVCPECGRVYISGGTTRTVTKSCGTENAGGSADDRFDVGISKPEDVVGGYFNEAV